MAAHVGLDAARMPRVAMLVGASLRIDLAGPIAVAFVIALLSLAAALLHFLREVFIATRSLTFGGTRPAPPDTG